MAALARRMICRSLLVAAGLVSLSVGSAGAAAPTWVGSWDTNWGRMEIRADGTGSYTYCDGTVAGTISGLSFNGTWTQRWPCGGAAGPNGPFELWLTGEGQRFDGRWAYPNSGWREHGWTGTCVAGACMDNGKPPAPMPPSVRPQVGVPASYAAPKPLKLLPLKLPVLGSSVRTATATLSVTRAKGLKINGPDFTFGIVPSAENAQAAHRLCWILLIADSVHANKYGQKFRGCTAVVARILQRAEELRKRRAQSPPVKRPPRCQLITVPLVGQRGRSPVTVTCKRSGAGIQLALHARSPGASLRSVLGSDPRLIVGQTRGAPAQSGDRVNVVWSTSNS